MNWTAYKPVYGTVLNSAFAEPEPQAVITTTDHFSSAVTFSGWAHGNGGKGTQAIRVELSFDEGRTWEAATDYIREQPTFGNKIYSWTLWRHDVPLWRLKQGMNRVWVRAVGSDGEI